MTAATIIGESSEFLLSNKICMAWPRHRTQLFIIAAASVSIGKCDGDWCTSRAAIEDSAAEFRNVLFLAGRSAFLQSASPSFEVVLEIVFTDCNSCRASIDHNAYAIAVRLTENTYPENPAETIHAIQTYCLKIHLLPWISNHRRNAGKISLRLLHDQSSFLPLRRGLQSRKTWRCDGRARS